MTGCQPLGMLDEWCESCIRLNPSGWYHTSESIPEQGPSVGPSEWCPPPCPPIDIQYVDERTENFSKKSQVCTAIYLIQHRSKLEAATTSSRPCSPGGNAENQRAQCLADLPRALYSDPLVLFFFFFFFLYAKLKPAFSYSFPTGPHRILRLVICKSTLFLCSRSSLCVLFKDLIGSKQPFSHRNLAMNGRKMV